MITAEETAKKIFPTDIESGFNFDDFNKTMKNFIIKSMTEFAKLHVRKALENAYDCHTFKGWTNSDDEKVHKELFVKNIMSRQSIK